MTSTRHTRHLHLPLLRAWETAHRRQADLHLELDRANALIRQSQAMAKVGGWEIDLGTNTLFWTEEVFRIHGLDPAAYRPTVASSIAFYAPEWRPVITRAVQRAIDQGEPFDLDLELLTATGRRLWVHATGEVLLQAGRAVKVRGAFRDISAERQAIETLSQGHALLAGILESAEGPIFSVDRAYRYTSFNRAHAQAMQALYGAEIALGDDLFDHQTVPEDREIAKANLDRALAGEAFRDEAMSGEEGCSRLFFEVAHTPIRDAEGAVTGVAVFARDTTRRHQAEEALQSTTSRVQKLFESDLMGITFSDLDEITAANDGFLHLVGYTRQELEAGLLRWPELTPPEWATADEKAIAELLDRGTCTPFEKEYIHKDGHRVPILLGIALLENSGFQCVCSIQDITERKRNEAALLQSEEHYRLLFTANPHPMWIYDLESLRILAVNDAAVCQYGYSREAFERLSIKDLRPAEDLPVLLERLANPAAVLRESAVLRHQKQDGEVLLVEVVSHPLTWMGRPARMVVAYDVTLRERARQELQASEINLRATFDQALVGMAQVGFDQRFLRVNRRFAEILGMREGELVGRSMASLTHPEDQLPAGALLQDILRGLGGSLIQEKRYFNHEGAAVWLQVLESVVSTGTAEPDYILKVVEDISDRKRLEGELQDLNRDLERRVDLRTQQLAAANQELEAFSYSVSHDLRAPIRAITGFSEALQRDGESRLSPAGAGHLQRIQEGAARMAQIVEDLLQLSRIGRDDFMAIPLDLGALAEQVLAGLQAAEPQRQVVCEVQRPLQVHGDPRLLRSLLDNLLGNAWKFTAGTADARITLRLVTVNSTGVEIAIQDNGAGFPAAQAAKLFRPFQRLHRAEDFPGSGIGLALAKRIISRHGGWIRAEGEPGQGAVFRFLLPLEQQARP